MFHFFFSVYLYHREQAKERETRKYLFVLRAVCYRFRIEHIYIWKHMNPYANEFGPLPLFACHRLNSNPNKVHTHKYNMLRCTFYSFYRIECRRYFYRYICSTYGCLCLYLILTLSSILIYHTIGKGGGVSFVHKGHRFPSGRQKYWLSWMIHVLVNGWQRQSKRGAQIYPFRAVEHGSIAYQQTPSNLSNSPEHKCLPISWLTESVSVIAELLINFCCCLLRSVLWRSIEYHACVRPLVSVSVCESSSGICRRKYISHFIWSHVYSILKFGGT